MSCFGASPARQLRSPPSALVKTAHLRPTVTGPSRMPSPAPTVLLVSVFKSTKIGGVSSHTSALAEGLERSGWEVRRVDFGSVTLTRSLRAVAPLLRFCADAAREVARHRSRGGRIVHIHSSKRALPFRLLGPLLHRLGCAVVLSLHSGIGYAAYLRERPRLLRTMDKLLRRTRHLLLMNQQEARELARLFPHHAHRISSIHPFIKPLPSQIPSLAQPLPRDPFVVTVAGLWSRFYHYEEAILAAHRFQARHSIHVEVRLLVGTSLVEPAYRAHVIEVLDGLARGNAQFGYTLQEDCKTVLAELATSSVLIRPAKVDSYGLVIAEALLVGTPAIATDVCKRVAGTILYAVGDTEGLDAELDGVYARQPAERVSLLPEGEDALSDYVTLYEELLGG